MNNLYKKLILTSQISNCKVDVMNINEKINKYVKECFFSLKKL